MNRTLSAALIGMDGPRLLALQMRRSAAKRKFHRPALLKNPAPAPTLASVVPANWGPCMSGEERKVLQVRAMCQVARGCAEVVATHDPDDRLYEYEKETYRKRKLRAIQITNSIQDRFYFETALHSIIDLCIAANELDDARRLFRTITVDVIRDQLLKSHPPLGRLS
jgi:hypothetical protein